MDKLLRVAIVGAGPSGFYVADALFKAGIDVQVDCFDKLPTPFGLLRGGVAPDHQKMKSVGAYYERVAEKNADRFNFFGNVKIGEDLHLDELHRFYNAIVFTYGAETDKKLGIPGEDLEGSHTATEFVAWYNGHPDYQDRNFDLSQENVYIIGQGNVAIDVTRILAKTPQELQDSDITKNAFDKLMHSKVKEIHLVGRRGPVQSAFTELEIKELGELDGADIVVNPDDLVLSDIDKAELELATNSKARKNMAVLETLSQKPLMGKPKKIILHFYQSPVALEGKSHVDKIELEINSLSGEPGAQKAKGTGQKVIYPAGLVFRSVGYRGLSIPDVPFDENKGVIPNEKGRVIEGNTPVAGLYTSGWIKRGASGVLGTNKTDGSETVACLIEDIPTLPNCNIPSTDEVKALLQERKVRWVSYDDWKKIDSEERSRGEVAGKPREKFCNVNDILEFLGHS